MGFGLVPLEVEDCFVVKVVHSDHDAVVTMFAGGEGLTTAAGAELARGDTVE